MEKGPKVVPNGCQTAKTKIMKNNFVKEIEEYKK